MAIITVVMAADFKSHLCPFGVSYDATSLPSLN